MPAASNHHHRYQNHHFHHHQRHRPMCSIKLRAWLRLRSQLSSVRNDVNLVSSCLLRKCRRLIRCFLVSLAISYRISPIRPIRRRLISSFFLLRMFKCSGFIFIHFFISLLCSLLFVHFSNPFVLTVLLHH